MSGGIRVQQNQQPATWRCSICDDGCTSKASYPGDVEILGNIINPRLDTILSNSVIYYGAVGDGSDATAAFSLAAKSVPVTNYLGGTIATGFARPERGEVYVPAGEYLLTELLDVGNRDIIWVLDYAAVITGIEFINGTVKRGTQRLTNQNPFEVSDYSTGFCATVGGPYADKPAPVTGVSTLQQLADYSTRDAVALIGAAYPREATVQVAAAAYTATAATIVPLTPDQLKMLRVGMIVDTLHATRCTGVLQSWSADGSILNVGEWRATGGGAPVTPADGTGLVINGMSKLWGGNFVIQLTADGYASQASGDEMTAYNERGDSSATLGNTTNRMIGKWSISIGTYKIQSHYMAVNKAFYGYVSQDVDTGFYAFSQTIGVGYKYHGGGSVLTAENLSNQPTLTVSSTGSMELGNLLAASSITMDFHTSGNNIDYDARISASGGSGVVGQGNLTLAGGLIAMGAVTRPNADNSYNLGAASFRWATVYAGTGTINTSDATLKDEIEEIPSDWLDAWGDVRWARFKFKDAIAAKGDNARWHVGLIAQKIEQAFAAKGLDAFEIGLLCRDPVTVMVTEQRFEDRPAMDEEEETTTREVIEADCVRVVTETKTVKKPRMIELPVIDENGEPVIETANGFARPLIRKVPVMESVMVDYEVERPTGEHIYGVRYEEAFALEAAYMRRELARR